MESPRNERYDPDEMRRFGFDPDDEADREAWARTTPPYGTAEVYDYSQDGFEFGIQPLKAPPGAEPRQQGETGV